MLGLYRKLPKRGVWDLLVQAGDGYSFEEMRAELKRLRTTGAKPVAIFEADRALIPIADVDESGSVPKLRSP